MNSASRMKASVGPEGRTERSSKSPEGRTERSNKSMMADTDARTDHETNDGS